MAGHVYRVQHQEKPEYKIDYDTKVLTLNKHPGTIQEECFVSAVFEIMMYHEDIPVKKANMKRMSKAWFRTLKINNCFTGTD